MTHYGLVSTIDDFLEAVVTLSVQGDGGATEDVDFIIDTGYAGELALPQDVIDRLDLQTAEYEDAEDDAAPTVMLADGTIRMVKVYFAGVWWHNRLRTVEVDGIGDVSLIGMGLLQDNNLSVDAVPGGLVTITELNTSS